MGRKRDVFWQYVDIENGNKCIFCGQGIPGASRIKFHLAQMRGGGISGCDNVPSDVQSAAASAINKNSCKRVKQSTTLSNLDDNIINLNLSSDSSRGKIGNLLPTTNVVGKQFQRYVEQMWEWLMKDDVSSIMGVWGMGGVGKTALLKHINNKLVNAKDDVIWVTVSQNYDILHLQKVIVRSIGVHLSDEDDKVIISGKLWDAFNSINKCVIILDDVWSDILLEDIGIPLIDNGIRIIITSRSLDVCTSIGCERNTVKVMPLSYEEAWGLFSKNLGDHGSLPSQAIQIAKSMTAKCGGLPLAIIKIARGMRAKADITDWRNALSKLRSIEMDQDDIKRCVFPVLKSSVDHLNNSTLLDFLLCLPLYDHHFGIRKDKLIRNLIEEGLINEKQSLEVQIDEVQSILNKLISNSLMEEGGWFENTVHSHLLVRAMTVSIGKESHGYMTMEELPLEEEWKEDWQKVSFIKARVDEIPSGMTPKCPKLSTFLMMRNYWIKVIPDNFFTNMPALKILNLSYSDNIEYLPMSISNLECLTVLLLYCCASLHHIPSLAKLRRLRNLNLHGTAITEVPQGFEKLTNLRRLNLLETKVRLKAQDLEGLKLLESIAIAFDNKDEFNACIQIIQDRLNFGVLMRGYFLHLQGDGMSESDDDDDDGDDIEHVIDKDKVLVFEGVENSTLMLPTDINELKIYGCHQWKSICDVLSSHGDNNKLNISRCTVSSCDELNYLFCSSGNCTLCCSLQGLDILSLEYLDSLSMLCMENQVPSRFCPFLYVRKLTIYKCNHIKMLMTLGMSTRLDNLEEIEVKDCESMEGIFSLEKSINGVDIVVDMMLSLEEIFALAEEEQPNEVEMDQTNVEVINLPNLKSVLLSGLPELNSVCKGIMRCGSLQEFNIFYCRKLQQLPQIQPPFQIEVW